MLSVRAYGASPGGHAHPHYQVLVGLDGVLQLELEGRGLRLGRGDTCVVRPSQRHDFFAPDRSRCLVLDSPASAWARCADAPAPGPATLALAGYLAQALAAGLPRAQWLGEALLLEAWAAPAHATRPRSARRIDWPALGDWAQRQAPQVPSAAELAEQACLSASQLAARCRQELGLSLMQWLRLERLAQARRLRDTGLAVAQVARQVGYRSPSALTAALRRESGRR